MIGYVTLGANNLAKAAQFYDPIAKELGYGRMMEFDTFIAWGDMESEQAGLALTKPFDGEPASVGNGTMVALSAKDPAQVERLHAMAIDMGAQDEGAPGNRGDDGFYAGYFRDPDGNKLNVFCYEQKA